MTWSRKRKVDRTCVVEGCQELFYARSMCKRHYYRQKKHGDPHVFKQARGADRFKGGRKWCSRHKDWLPLSCFTGNKTWCRSCRRLSRYGLRPDQYEVLLKSCGGQCQICQVRDAEVVDHDHACCPGRQTCGRCIRGMLCRACNAALGVLTEEGVQRAATYISKKL